MRTYRQIVKEATTALKNHKFGTNAKVLNLWNEVEWQEIPKADGKRDAELSPSAHLIALYPALLQSPKAVSSVLREFGLLIQRTGGDRAALIWDKKLDLPTPEQAKTVAQKLEDPEIRNRCKTYEHVKDTYPETGSAVDRLVFINVANALLANNVPFRDSQGVDVFKWGPASQYLAFKKYHYLTPLTSAYCPPEVNRCFGCAFAEMVLTDLKCCRDSSVAAAMRRIIGNVISRLEPYPVLSDATG